MTTRAEDVVRVGTRRSRLARAQTAEVRALIEEALDVPTEEVLVTSRGDRDPTQPLSAMVRDGPGLFTRALEDALAKGDVDVVVHSLKDMPLKTPDALPVVAIPGRADPRDVLVVREDAFDETRKPLPVKPGTRVGTSAPRRQAQLAAADAEAVTTDVRGNVDTRLGLIGKGVVDAVVLANAGLERSGVPIPGDCHAVPLPLEQWPSSPGQGFLAVQARADDPLAEALTTLDDPEARAAVVGERSILAALGGGCGLPLGATMRPDADGWRMDAAYAKTSWWRPPAALARATVSGPDPQALADAVHAQLQGAPVAEAGVTPADASEDVLAGWRVLLTFDVTTAEPYVDALRGAGAEAAAWPFTAHRALPVKPVPPKLRKAAPDAQWIVVASARAVRAARVLHEAGATHARYAAVGPATARAMRLEGLPVHCVSPDGTAKGLAGVIAAWTKPEGPVLAPGAADPTPDLADALGAAGFDVIQWPVYKTRPLDPPSDAPLDLPVDALVVTAPSAANALPAGADAGTLAERVIAFGPSTAKALTDRGIPVSAVMPRRSPQALLETLRS